MFEKNGTTSSGSGSSTASTLRGKLSILENEYKSNKISYNTFKLESNQLLRQIELCDTLNVHEKELLKSNKSVVGNEGEGVSNGDICGTSVLNNAGINTKN